MSPRNPRNATSDSSSSPDAAVTTSPSRSRIRRTPSGASMHSAPVALSRTQIAKAWRASPRPSSSGSSAGATPTAESRIKSGGTSLRRGGPESLRRASPRARGLGGTGTSPFVSGDVVGGAVENLGGTVARLLRASDESADAEPGASGGENGGGGDRRRPAKPRGAPETSPPVPEPPAAGESSGSDAPSSC